MEIKAQLDEIAKGISEKNEALTKALESKASKEEILGLKTSIELMSTKASEIQNAVIQQGEAITSLKADKIITDDPASAVYTALKKAKEQLGKMKESGKGSFSFEIKNADRLKATVSSAEVVDTTIGTRVAGIGEIPYRRRFLEDVLQSAAVSDGRGNVLQYTDQANVLRSANNVAECAVYPALTDIDWQEFTCKIEKIGDTIKVCREAMDDFDFVESEIRNLLMTSVEQRVDQQLLLGTGTTPQLKGIDLVASAFAAGAYALSIDNATLFDLIHVIKSQIMTVSENMFDANIALMNPVDVTKLLSTKDLDGNYIIPPFATDNGRTINGVRIIENTLVAANTMYVFDSSKATVYNRKSMTLDVSFENEDDFNKDLVTIKASRRLALLIRNVHANAFTKVADITAAITAIDKP